MATKKAPASQATKTGTLNIDKIKDAAQTNLVEQLQQKTFSSGKVGYYAQSKITVDGVRFQSQMMMVELAPKE